MVNEFPKEVEFETIREGRGGCNPELGYYVYTNVTFWEQVNDTYCLYLPVVDFNNSIVLAVYFGGATTGYSIIITHIIEHEEILEVFVTETSPGDNCMTFQMRTLVYHMVRIQRVEKHIEFTVEHIVDNCDRYNSISGYNCLFTVFILGLLTIFMKIMLFLRRRI